MDESPEFPANKKQMTTVQCFFDISPRIISMDQGARKQHHRLLFSSFGRAIFLTTLTDTRSGLGRAGSTRVQNLDIAKGRGGWILSGLSNVRRAPAGPGPPKFEIGDLRRPHGRRRRRSSLSTTGFEHGCWQHSVADSSVHSATASDGRWMRKLLSSLQLMASNLGIGFGE